MRKSCSCLEPLISYVMHIAAWHIFIFSIEIQYIVCVCMLKISFKMISAVANVMAPKQALFVLNAGLDETCLPLSMTDLIQFQIGGNQAGEVLITKPTHGAVEGEDAARHMLCGLTGIIQTAEQHCHPRLHGGLQKHSSVLTC